jgi:hypothetical protein
VIETAPLGVVVVVEVPPPGPGASTGHPVRAKSSMVMTTVVLVR